jgi:hypothetical protein
MNPRWIGVAFLAGAIALGGIAYAATVATSQEAPGVVPSIAELFGANGGNATAGVAHADWGPSFGHHRGHLVNGHGRLVGFVASNGTEQGLFLSFEPNATSGAIDDVAFQTANGTAPLAESLTLVGSSGSTVGALRDGGYLLSSNDARVLLVDAPQGMLVGAATGNATVTIVLAPAATATVHPAVSAWSPAGATIRSGSAVVNIVLSNGATANLTGAELTLHLHPGSSIRALPAQDSIRPMPRFAGWHPFGFLGGHGWRR